MHYIKKDPVKVGSTKEKLSGTAAISPLDSVAAFPLPLELCKTMAIKKLVVKMPVVESQLVCDLPAQRRVALGGTFLGMTGRLKSVKTQA